MNVDVFFFLMCDSCQEVHKAIKAAVLYFFPSFLLEKDVTSCSEIMQIPPAGSNPFDTKSEDEGEAEGEGEHSLQVQEEEEAFLEPELADRLPFMKQRSRHAIAVEEKSFDSFHLPSLMADEALRTCKCFLAPLSNDTLYPVFVISSSDIHCALLRHFF